MNNLMTLAYTENKKAGDCIKDWYYGKSKEHTARLIRNFMETYRKLESPKGFSYPKRLYL